MFALGQDVFEVDCNCFGSGVILSIVFESYRFKVISTGWKVFRMRKKT